MLNDNEFQFARKICMPNCCALNYKIYKYSKNQEMENRTFAEKIFDAQAGSIVFKKPILFYP